ARPGILSESKGAEIDVHNDQLRGSRPSRTHRLAARNPSVVRTPLIRRLAEHNSASFELSCKLCVEEFFRPFRAWKLCGRLTQGVARRLALPWAIFFRAFSPSESEHHPRVPQSCG